MGVEGERGYRMKVSMGKGKLFGGRLGAEKGRRNESGWGSSISL